MQLTGITHNNNGNSGCPLCNAVVDLQEHFASGSQIPRLKSLFYGQGGILNKLCPCLQFGTQIHQWCHDGYIQIPQAIFSYFLSVGQGKAFVKSEYRGTHQNNINSGVGCYKGLLNGTF
ncbi:hypothetical protein ES705_39435 [subsurface metagenome]